MQIVQLVDDLDHLLPADETLTFVVDDVAYAVDLCAVNAKGFREAVEPYRAVARRLGRHKVTAALPVRSSRSKEKKASPEVPADWYRVASDDSPEVKAAKQEYRKRVRAWALEAELLQGRRGTIPRDVYAAYEEWAGENGVATGPASVGL